MLYTDNFNRLKQQLRRVPEKTSALESLDRIKTNTKQSKQAANESHATRETKAESNKPTYDVVSIVQNLSMNAERVVESLLGEPNQSLSSNREYRYGTKGSLSFCLQGEKRGTWYNFESGEKGNLLHLIQSTLKLNFTQSLEYAAKLTGDDLKVLIKQTPKKDEATKSNKPDNSSTRDYARQLAMESVPVQGTLAEKYLKEIRAIHDISGHDIRFHPKVWTHKSEPLKYRPAFLSIARDKDTQIQAVEAVYLDEKTAQKAVMDIKAKKSFGIKKNACVVINEGHGRDAVTYIAEGIETGLSVRDAVKSERVIATLGKGNFRTIDPSMLTDKVVFCVDNDGKPITGDSVILDSVKRMISHGKTVEVVVPKHQGDFNDIAKLSGVSGTVSAMKNTIHSSVFNPLSLDVEMDSKKINENIRRTISSGLNSQEINVEKTRCLEQDKFLTRLEREIY